MRLASLKEIQNKADIPLPQMSIDEFNACFDGHKECISNNLRNTGSD